MIRQLLALGLVVSLTFLIGCGSGLVETKGTVTLDGKAVAGATVTFYPQGGGTTATGVTDSSGEFTLSSGNKKGIASGSYKVAVTKTKSAISGDADMKPGSPEYMKLMSKAASTGPGGGAISQNQLPDKYSTESKTPLTVTIPSSTPIKLELSSK